MPQGAGEGEVESERVSGSRVEVVGGSGGRKVVEGRPGAAGRGGQRRGHQLRELRWWRKVEREKKGTEAVSGRYLVSRVRARSDANPKTVY